MARYAIPKRNHPKQQPLANLTINTFTLSKASLRAPHAGLRHATNPIVKSHQAAYLIERILSETTINKIHYQQDSPENPHSTVRYATNHKSSTQRPFTNLTNRPHEAESNECNKIRYLRDSLEDPRATLRYATSKPSSPTKNHQQTSPPAPRKWSKYANEGARGPRTRC
ncbi:hypothetical protein HYFRA_00004602 [Hymenoscyphus fraxineus]|uniref:Uncharacterized protein n=1 Tax=Hymenoscyphus fraxineus TaxID=746836 RepID=A0A9N9PT03_9HELO|nr:hypothetical protein HYFRA_00004602 [Hymenoscyphus fraxineus]